MELIHVSLAQILSSWHILFLNYNSKVNIVSYVLLPPATKLGQGNIFRSVCQQFCPRGGRAWLPGGVCMVLFGGHAWFYSGGYVVLFSGGACVVLFSGGRVWFYLGGMHGFIQWGACVVLFSRGACVVLFGGHAWFYSVGGCAWFYSVGGCAWFYSAGGMHGFIQGGHAWFFQFFRIQWDTVNERAVRILLECILVFNIIFKMRMVMVTFGERGYWRDLLW